LFGREAELKQISRALFAHGRHVFIYGDRGVGKSSLGATAAGQYQTSDAAYLDVSCSPEATLASVVANVAYQALKIRRTSHTVIRHTTDSSFKLFRFARQSETSVTDLHESIRTITDAVEVLRDVAQIHSEKPVILIDEFDRMKDKDERVRFA